MIKDSPCIIASAHHTSLLSVHDSICQVVIILVQRNRPESPFVSFQVLVLKGLRTVSKFISSML